MTFPTLRLRGSHIEPIGAFAEAQAAFFDPSPERVTALRQALADSDAAVVAHFYMDAQLQSVLLALDSDRVFIADSLAMAGAAVRFAEAGAKAVVVLGVDFMAENVRALLTAKGYGHVPVYRLAQSPIGCSLAESADSQAYMQYLDEAAKSQPAAHVIYVNTSLGVKSAAASRLPTVTCTSSNVVKTLLEIGLRAPRAKLFFGPDTFMGANIAHLLESLAKLDPKTVASLHPEATPALLDDVRGRFEWFRQGVCIVHDMFGEEVVDAIRRDYPDAAVTAHFEVPGEMFALGLAAQAQGRGVVGSTSHILNFIEGNATVAGRPQQFILGTESGMAASIVEKLRASLPASAPPVDIIFPVAAEAVTVPGGTPDLPLMPGPAGAEGCAPTGGCATCPYMKQNSLDALERVLLGIGNETELGGYRVAGPGDPEAFASGIDSMLEMQHFQATGHFRDAFIARLT